MRRFAALPFALLFLTACASSRHTPMQTIGVHVVAPRADVERFYNFDVGNTLATAIASDFAKEIGPVDLNPPAGMVPSLSVSVVWERYAAATSREQQDIWFTLHYRLTTAAGVHEGSIPAWGVKPSTYRTVDDENLLVIRRAVAALRSAVQKSL